MVEHMLIVILQCLLRHGFLLNFSYIFVLFGKTAKQWKDENPGAKGNMRDVATLNQLLVLANLESYNAVLIGQRKNQKERMELLRQLAVQQLQTLETVSLNSLPKLDVNIKKTADE